MENIQVKIHNNSMLCTKVS